MKHSCRTKSLIQIAITIDSSNLKWAIIAKILVIILVLKIDNFRSTIPIPEVFMLKLSNPATYLEPQFGNV